MYSLSEARLASIRGLSVAATLLVMGHCFFLFVEIAGPTQSASGEVAFWLCVTPLLLAGLRDFRAALLFSVVATPIFFAPTVPSLFTQGAGDLFALIAVSSFLFSHWRQVIRVVSGVQVILLLIPAAALLSILFNLADSEAFQWNQAKYEIAEFAGLSLAVAYSLLLAWSIRAEKDFKALLIAVFIAVAISVVMGIISLILMSVCMPDLAGTVVSSGGQISGGFGNPNYYGSWMLVLLPIILYQISSRQLSVSKSTAYVIVLVIFLLLLLLTVSRSTLLALICVLLVWGGFAQGWINKSKVMVIVLILAVFFPAVWNARFAACRDTDSSLVDYVFRTNTLAFMQSGVAGKFVDGKTTQDVQLQLDASGHEHPTRTQLLMFSWEAWLSSPVFGIGPGNLASLVREQTGIGERAHNVVATVLAEQGAVGLLAWLVFYVMVLWRVWRAGWGCAGSRPHHVVYGKYLFLIFLSLSITSLFADQHRVIWLWMFVGLVFSSYFSSDDRATTALGYNLPESSG